jgi:uncharacterized protein YdeI (YjbR/CyaY-like superfamily)
MITTRARRKMSDEVRERLKTSGTMPVYEERPPYQRNDYLIWIESAKRPETRRKRIDKMVDELKRGDVYMNMPWHSGKES